MDKRVRSPNYPAIGLQSAIEKLSDIYRKMHTHPGPREVVAKAMGYQSLNGASATALSALHKYGLLDRIGEDVKVSDRAIRILHPHSDQERRQAIEEAAIDPSLFVKLSERFPGQMPNDELLRNYLIREGFSPSAVPSVVQSYRETSEFVQRECGVHDSPAQSMPSAESHTMQPQQVPMRTPSPTGEQNKNERQIGVIDLEGGGYVRIVCGGEIDTEEALEWAEDIIQRKRRELDKRKQRVSVSITEIAEE